MESIPRASRSAFVIPPGPLYLLKLLPFFLGPPTVAISILRADAVFANRAIPTWLYIAAALLARPLFSVFQRYYTRYSVAKAAAASGAFVIPHVQEERPAFAGLSLMKQLVQDLKNGYPGDLILKWKEMYGNVYQLRLVSDNRIVTFEPDHFKAILATQFESFGKGPILHSQLKSLLGIGVFNSDGLCIDDQRIRFHRTMTRPFFTRDRISDFDIFEDHADRALKLAKDRLAEGQAVDIQDLTSRFTLDSATQYLFGHDVQSLSAGLPYSPESKVQNSTEFLNHPSNVFADAFLAAQIQVAYRARMGPNWPMGEFWGDKIAPLRRILEDFIEPPLRKALEEKKQRELLGDSKVDDSEGETLLKNLVQETQDFDVLKDEMINLLVAGRDTTSTTLTYAFYMLAEHPDIAERLRNEILDIVGPTNRPSYDNLRDLKYLRAFLNGRSYFHNVYAYHLIMNFLHIEVLRLYPPVPFNSRMSTEAAIWTSRTPGSKPYYVPKNTRILYSIFHMHRRTDLWGPDAEEFDPDRFLDERLHKYITPNPYIFLPFNAGPRICLGQQFALQEASFFLVKMLQQFTNFRLAPDAQPEDSKPPASWAEGSGRRATEKIRPAMHLTLFVKGGLWGRMDEVKA
ncbi:Cytochrome P450 monooxygenase 75 [Psilocybe cubensis]|uniref:Cytochrome P450 monooxygenase 75 n=1 Tax=Psilocybe cubensis TaxID=181762 RepID=A0ACB8H5T1_PSICU|nr:Cytochrome P450 monooxygenase 75 [Psilocybe cubensis]KAH9483075.1 Cytochrome P450 monooxygenase 75 [Psilocybe cubensis]